MAQRDEQTDGAQANKADGRLTSFLDSLARSLALAAATVLCEMRRCSRTAQAGERHLYPSIHLLWIALLAGHGISLSLSLSFALFHTAMLPVSFASSYIQSPSLLLLLLLLLPPPLPFAIDHDDDEVLLHPASNSPSLATSVWRTSLN